MAKSNKTEQYFEMNNPASSSSPIGSAEGAPTAPTSSLSVQQQIMLSAVEAHFAAKRARAIANLNAYMLSSVGIGEHPDIVGECIKLVEEADHAESAIQTLGRIIQ